MVKIKYKIVLLRREFSSLRLMKIITLSQITNKVSFNGKTFIVNVTQPTYINNNQIFFFLDFESGNQMFFNEKQNPLNPSEIDMIINNKFMKDIIAGATDNTKEKFVNMLIGFVVGVLLSALVAMLYVNAKTDEIYSKFLSFDTVTGAF